jgi:hypothetical protein
MQEQRGTRVVEARYLTWGERLWKLQLKTPQIQAVHVTPLLTPFWGNWSKVEDYRSLF